MRTPEPLDITLNVAVPDTSEPTRCRIKIWTPPEGGPPLALLCELPDNPGLSVTAAFSFVAEQVRTLLPPGSPEPMWIEHWPDRAVAAVLLERSGPATDTLVMGAPGSWARTPLPPGAIDSYVRGTTGLS